MTWCWWCCHPFESQVLHLPYKCDPLTRKFHTTGCFCSWGCMRAFALSEYSDAQGSAVCSYVSMMAKQTTGTRVLIKTAPSRWALRVFGGTLSIEEFRDSVRDTRVIVRMPNEVHKLHSVVEAIKPEQRVLTDTELDMKLRDIQTASGAVEPLKLKRTKPLKRDALNNLEKTLGITRSAKM